MKASSIKAGDRLWMVRAHRMGNTTLRTVAVYAVEVIEMRGGLADCVWNGYNRGLIDPRQLRASVRTIESTRSFGTVQLARRGEQPARGQRLVEYLRGGDRRVIEVQS